MKNIPLTVKREGLFYIIMGILFTSPDYSEMLRKQ